jgi:3-hydroxyisobutyrate dehydrogenase-like beta-hydroxyacid dehydrogenase
LNVATRTVGKDGNIHTTILHDAEARMKIGILHPGEMGISVAASAQNSGHEVFWASVGRGEKTRMRAEKQRLTDAGSLADLCKTCSIILSVCPPHIAEDVAKRVIAAGFKGLYLDANAISPQKSKTIGKTIRSAGIDFVDGGIIGTPAWESGQTWLYLSGKRAEEIAACFAKGPLETKVIGDEIGKASALKMCYAAYTKGTTALLCAVIATAESLNMREELFQQWDMDDAGSSRQAAQRVTRVTAKAWRFAGEMDEIAATFNAAGLPSGFHESAAEIFCRMADFKDASTLPELSEVLASLQKQHPAV